MERLNVISPDRHFTRSFLTEVDRLRRVRHIQLPPLTKKEVRQQLTAILSVPAGPSTADRTFRRSDGNAFLVEELANPLAGARQADLSASLRDLLLTRLHAPPTETQRLLRTMGEGGEIIARNLLKTVTALPETDMLAALRSAVDACIILPGPDNDGYRFRHLLAREAVSADLLPGERRQINRTHAEALEADPSLVRADERAFRLAIHWYAADEPVQALPAILKAATEAQRHRANAEQVYLLEYALNTWDETTEETQVIMDKRRWPEDYPAHPHLCAVAPLRVLQAHATSPVTKPEPPTADGGLLAPLRKLGLMAEATGAAYLAGDRDRSMTLAWRALSALKEHQDPLYSAWFWIQISCLKQESGNGDGREELTMAEHLAHGLPPSVLHADISTNIASWEALNHPGPEILKSAELSRRYTRNVGANQAELHARADALIAEAHLITVKLGALSLADELEVLRAQLNGSNIQTRPPSTKKKQSGLEVLTARELEVLHLIARGYSNRGIGHELRISAGTVSIHVSHILAKLKATNRTEAAGMLRSLIPGTDPDHA